MIRDELLLFSYSNFSKYQILLTFGIRALEMATEGGFVQPSIPRFDGHYDHWCMLMENFLRSKEYWGLIEDEVPTAVDGV